jgi:hypothetical protein
MRQSGKQNSITQNGNHQKKSDPNNNPFRHNKKYTTRTSSNVKAIIKTTELTTDATYVFQALPKPALLLKQAEHKEEKILDATIFYRLEEQKRSFNTRLQVKNTKQRLLRLTRFFSETRTSTKSIC